MALLFRRWNAMRGGVYAPVTEDAPPNPYLDVPERDIQTLSGRQLTLINPAYMTRQIYELQAAESGILGHITSLNPIRPENAADPWETEALRAFERGETEMSTVEDIKGVSYMRLMRPLLTEASCLKCHAAQGYQEGDIRGGISVSVPMSPLRATAQKYVTSLVLAHGVLWLLGLSGVVWGARRLDEGIRERKQAEEALRESNRRLEGTLAELRDTQEQMMQQERLATVGQLAAGIAHDFRNLLTTIILYTNMALRKPDLPPKLAQNLETIVSESKKAADLVQQILDFSSRSMIRVQAIDLQSLTQNVIGILRRTILENVYLTLTMGTEEYIVAADPGRIEQALMNLALNARDAMPEGGELRFELSKMQLRPDDEPPVMDMGPGEWVCLTVSDVGIGMTEEVQAHLFEPFFTTRDVGKGTGLGLAQVYGIVRQHEGYIGVETELGQGTTFRIYLPAYEEEVKETEAEDPPAPPQGQGETILLVEDNEKLRKVVQKLLESLGYRVLTAANGREALAMSQVTRWSGSHKQRVALVITDLVMPEMGGKELMQELRKTRPTLKALGITGYAVEKVAEELWEVGFLDVIRKPFEINALARAIHRALDAN